MTVIQPPTFVADGCYEAISFRHVLAAAANGVPGILQGLDVTAIAGRDITFDEGSALAPGTTFDEGFYQVVVTAPEVVTVGVGDATDPRIDIIVAKVTTQEYGDPGDTAALVVVPGTPAEAPVAPAVPNRSVLLASVNVGKGITVLTSDDVIQTRQRPGVSSVPVGAVMPYAGASAPDGFVFCDGSSLNKAAYPDLFAAIGGAYGSGATTFNVPDLRGRMPIGVGDGPSTSNRTLGQQGGVETVTLTPATIPAHNHDVSGAGAHGHTLTGAWNYPGLFGGDGGYSGTAFLQAYATNPATTDVGHHIHSVTGGGTGGAHENMSPFLALNFIIRAT